MVGWMVAAALAQEAAVPESPMPIAGAPWAVHATAYALPAPDPAWLTTEERFHACRVLVALLHDGTARVSPLDCPEPMVAAAVAATQQWRFAPAVPESASGETSFTVDYIARYEPALGALTLHVEVDPGEEEAFAGATGVPGVQLVHPAQVVKAFSPKVPAEARKAGVAAQACPVTVTLDTRGKVARAEVGECPEALVGTARAAAAKWKFTPRVVDANTQPSELTIEVVFR